MRPAAQSSAHCPISTELEDFLQLKASSVQSLTDYPLIASDFVKENSTLFSAAAVERLFSTAANILLARRCKMTDKLFDMMDFLKCRHHISS